jgi:hypothetical protein
VQLILGDDGVDACASKGVTPCEINVMASTHRDKRTAPLRTRTVDVKLNTNVITYHRSPGSKYAMEAIREPQVINIYRTSPS